MANYLTIDGGTTNTRLYLVENGTVRAKEKIGVGARNGKEAIRSALQKAVPAVLAGRQIEAVIASGMITSDRGLCTVDHLPVPAGVQELHYGMKCAGFSEINSVPFWFIPGVKMMGTTMEETDMMRGEETELAGLSEALRPDALYVLPGSHSKLIEVDKKQRIKRFQTSLTGELISAILSGTILKDAAEFRQETPREKDLTEGYENCMKNGLNRALFQIRTRKILFGASAAECYGYLLGAVLCGEIGQILRSEKQTVIVGGQKQLRGATAVLLKRYSGKEIVSLPDIVVEESAMRGAIRIFETG